MPRDVIKACFPYSGVYDLRDLAVYGQPDTAGPGGKLLVQPKDAVDASPITWLEGNETPFFITWAENDNALCKAEGPAFLVALRDQPGRAEGHMFPMFDHFWIHLDQQHPENLHTRTLLAWMKGDARTVPMPVA